MAYVNPFKPGAGHQPPYLAGRDREHQEVQRLLGQDTIVENMILTGLRGVGKTVLLETFKPIAQQSGWLWVGEDFSEAASVSESKLAERIIADLAVLTSATIDLEQELPGMGFLKSETVIAQPLGYDYIRNVYDSGFGLVSDRLKTVLRFVWEALPPGAVKGIVFAYDEAQNLSDHSQRDEFPLSLLLDVFQSLQRSGIPFMLILTGLPTLFPKLVDARTFAERMFHVVTLEPLTPTASREAILKPLENSADPVTFADPMVDQIVEMSGGYPYFIQFICREVYDAWLARINAGTAPEVPVREISHKLDEDFFAGRWSRATDRQRDLMTIISTLPNCDAEFTVQDVVERSKEMPQKSFSASHVNQMLGALIEKGLIYKNRFGRYSFAVPLLADFIRRQNGGV